MTKGKRARSIMMVLTSNASISRTIFNKLVRNGVNILFIQAITVTSLKALDLDMESALVFKLVILFRATDLFQQESGMILKSIKSL